jgi:hypothetical protein
MAFWSKRKNKQQASASNEAPEALYLTEGEGAQAPSTPANPAVAFEMTSSESRPADGLAVRAQQAAATADVSHQKEKAEAKEKARSSSSELEQWRRGVKGRPTKVFIGFLSNASKQDAVRYAIGVAENNTVSVVNSAYAIFHWNDGWAYEVHEGGPCRAYLPAILRFFDAQSEHANLDDSVVTISTAGRSVRVERSHTGLTAFLMPESFNEEQTEWLEPGPKLKPAAPVRLGVLAAGGAIFGTGFLAMMVALLLRPDAPTVVAQKQDIPYDQLPISLWPTLLKASTSGYVNALQYSNGEYTFSITGQSEPGDTVVTLPPPLPAPVLKEKQ